MVSDNLETFADLNGHYKCGQRCGIQEFGGGGAWAGDFSPVGADDAPPQAGKQSRLELTCPFES